MPLSFEEFVQQQREAEAAKTAENKSQPTSKSNVGYSPGGNPLIAAYESQHFTNNNAYLPGFFGRNVAFNKDTGRTEQLNSPAKSWEDIAAQENNPEDFWSDSLQATRGALARQGANYLSWMATHTRGMSGLLHKDNYFDPGEVDPYTFLTDARNKDLKFSDRLIAANDYLASYLTHATEAQTDTANRLLADSKAGRGYIGSFIMDLESGAVDLITDQLVNLATEGIGGMILMGIRTSGAAAEEARQKGQSLTTQGLKGMKSAAIEVGTEFMFEIGGLKSGGEGWAEKLLGKATSRFASKGGNKVLGKLAKAFGSEAVEEMASDIFNPLADRLIAGIAKGDYDVEDMPSFGDICYDGLVGGVLGLLSAGDANVQREVQDGTALETIGKIAEDHVETVLDRAAAAKQNSEATSQTNEKADISAKESAPTETPEAAKPAEKAASVEFNSKPEEEADVPFTFGEETAPEAVASAPEIATAAEENPVVTETPESATMEAEEAAPRQRGIGKKTGERLAGAAFLADAAKQRAANEAEAAKRGVEVDASDFEDSQPKATSKSNALVEHAKENSKSRLEKMQDARDRALAQNGVDYSYDPREKYWNSELGEYNEIDISDGTLSEEEIAEYLRDMRQIRLLDALDSWIDKNFPKFFKDGKNNNPESWRTFENAIRDEVQRRVAQQPNDDDFAISKGREEEKRDRRVEAGEASREVAQDKADEARLKGKKRTQKFTENGFTAVPIGNGLYRVTGPSGNTSLEVAAADAADAVQKYNDNLTEESRKAAKERKVKEAELEKIRKEVIESGKNPARVDGSDGNTYEVTKQFSNERKTRYEYVVTELDEDGLPSDREARVFQNRANTNEEAVQYAIDNDLFKTDDYSDLVEGSNDEEQRSKSPERESLQSSSSRNQRGNDFADAESDAGGRGNRSQGESRKLVGSDADSLSDLPRVKVDEPFQKAIEKDFGEGAFATAIGGWHDKVCTFVSSITGHNSVWVAAGLNPQASANHSNGNIGFSIGSGKNATPTRALASAHHEVGHYAFWRNPDVKPQAFCDAVYKKAKVSGELQKAYSLKIGTTYLFSDELLEHTASSIDLDSVTEYVLKNDEKFASLAAEEVAVRMLNGEASAFFEAKGVKDAQEIQKAAQEKADGAGLLSSDITSLFPTFEELKADYASPSDKTESFKRWADIDKFIAEHKSTLALAKSLDEVKAATSNMQDEREPVIADNAKEYAYQKKLAGETDVDEEFAKAAMPEDLDGLSERIKSSDNKFYGERKANITKAAEAISKNIGKDASTVLPEDLFDFVGKDFSQASKDIDGFAKEFLTALATEDDGVALKTLADDLPKRIKKSKALKELLGDAETGNVAKMARVLAEAEDAKTAQNAASDLAEMIAKEAEEMPKRLKTLEQWDKNLSKRGVIARFLSGNKTVSRIASVYFGYQRDMINVLQGLDNFDKYGDGYGYKLAKKILDANFKSQTALGNSIDHVLTAQSEFEKSGGANKTVELKMLKKNQRESHQISLAEAVDFLHTIRTLQASKVNAWQDITYLVGDQKLTISSLENFNRVLDALTKAVRNDKAANAYYQSFTDGYAMFKDVTKDSIRDASGRTVDMYEDGSYYPLLFAKKGEASAEHDFDFGLDSTKFTQRRVNELGGVISITDPAVRFNSYAHVAANLVARAATGAEVERLNRGGLGKSITSLVEERYGKGATDTVKQYIKDSSNFRQESDTASSLLRNLRLNIQGGALFGNFGSMLKQYPSVYNAAGVLDFDSITHGIIAQINAGNRKRAAKLGSIKTRHQGNLDPSVAETLNESSGFKKAMEKLKILKFAKEGFEIVDSAAIRTIYLASEYQVEVKDNISRDSAEFNDRVMDYFIPAFLQTQPQFEKTLRPFVQTSDSELIRMFGMFKTQPLRNLNTMIRTISEYNTVKEKYGTDSKEFKETEKQLRHTVAGQASASLMFGALGVLAKLLYHRRKDLEDEEGNLDAGKVMSRVLMNAAEASGGMLVFGDAAVQLVIDMASGGKTNEFYGLSAGAVSSVADALDAATTFAEKPSAYNAKRAAGYISTLFGIPLNNAYAILNSAIMYGKDISGSNEGNYDDILKYLDAQAKAAKKEAAKAEKAAEKTQEDYSKYLLEAGGESSLDVDTYSSVKETVRAAKKDTSLYDSSKDVRIMDDILKENLTDVQVDEVVDSYLSQPFNKPYDAMRAFGLSPSDATSTIKGIDTDRNGSIKQQELLDWYSKHPEQEAMIQAVWSSYGWKTTWEKAKAKAS